MARYFLARVIATYKRFFSSSAEDSRPVANTKKNFFNIQGLCYKTKKYQVVNLPRQPTQWIVYVSLV